jgi:NAD(P)H-dependent nitrite reductase small subunit
LKKKYIKISDIDSIPKSTGKKIIIENKSIALFMSKNNIYAIHNSCPHQGADIADGHVKDGKAVCPLHRWQFDLETGAFSGNENIRIPTYKTKVEGNDVYVLLDDD